MPNLHHSGTRSHMRNLACCRDTARSRDDQCVTPNDFGGGFNSDDLGLIDRGRSTRTIPIETERVSPSEYV